MHEEDHTVFIGHRNLQHLNNVIKKIIFFLLTHTINSGSIIIYKQGRGALVYQYVYGDMQLSLMYTERTQCRSLNIIADIHSGHIVNSGMTVIVRWGAIAVFVICKHSSSFLTTAFYFIKNKGESK